MAIQVGEVAAVMVAEAAVADLVHLNQAHRVDLSEDTQNIGKRHIR